MEKRTWFWLLFSISFVVVAQGRLKNLHIVSEIQSRFAVTEIRGTMENWDNRDKEVSFTTRVPKDAYISNFTMEINGRLTVAEVKEKDSANSVYQRAKQRGETTAQVLQLQQRDNHVFQVQLNVGSGGSVKFQLTYQEVLKRVHGVYKHVINVSPLERVEESIRIDVVIADRKRITRLHVPDVSYGMGLKTNDELLRLGVAQDVEIKRESKHTYEGYVSSASVVKRGGGVGGQEEFVLLYDVQRSADGGDIVVVDGYFVHFLAPQGLREERKNVVFVLDKSGSMQGKKYQQIVESMRIMLRELRAEDRFNVVMFNDKVEQWMGVSQLATLNNIQDSITWIQNQRPYDLTNIHDALKSGLRVLNRDAGMYPGTSFILFLTDGRPTRGRRDRNFIIRDITQRNPDGYSIHSVAFGPKADYPLLQQISYKNKGVARRLYEEADADLQLAGFFKEISSPLLNNLQIRYLNPEVDVDSLVSSSNVNGAYMEGGEMIMAGKIAQDSNWRQNRNTDQNLRASISGMGRSGNMYFSAESADPPRLHTFSHNGYVFITLYR